MLKYFSNYNNKYSISLMLRKKRFMKFMKLLKHKSGLTILDIGGFGNSLEVLSEDFVKSNNITILNIENVDVFNKNTKYIMGDATNEKQFQPKSFDVIYCNSVIEHVGDFNKMKKLASNIRNWGVYYFVQTPAYYFPIEPHFLVPFFHFLPHKIRAYILTKFELASFPREENYYRALSIVSSVRLLKKKEFKLLFPEATILKEKFMFITKSYIAHNIGL